MLRMLDLSRPVVFNGVVSFVNTKECELYCATKRSCCGCIQVCNVTCQWNAISDCERMMTSNQGSEKCLSEKPTCFDIQLNAVGETQNESERAYGDRLRLKKAAMARWRLGSCNSLNSSENGDSYVYPALYTERCCLKPGRHTLVCYNSPPSRGWNNTYILINGQRYCDDFISYQSFQTILVTTINIANIT